jgi:hypothetical protein
LKRNNLYRVISIKVMMTNDEPGDGTMVLLGGCQLDEVELGWCVGCVVDDDED